MVQRWVALGALAASGCTKSATETNGARPGGGEPALGGPLCAECGPFAGGESSDFEGDVHECAAFGERQRISDEEATALGVDIATLRARLRRDFEAPMRWVPTASLGEYPDLVAGSPPSGFTAETSVSGALRPTGDLLYPRLAPERCDSEGSCSFPDRAPIPCAGYVANISSMLELELDIETADGAIEAITLPGLIAVRPGELPPRLFAEFSADLSEVSGALELDPDRAGPYAGRLEAELVLGPGLLRGRLAPLIAAADATPRAVLDDTPSGPAWIYRPITAVWPADGCDLLSLPIDAATAEGRAAIERLGAEYPAAKAFVNAASPMLATWDDVRAPGRDGDGVQLGLELLGEPELRCVEPDGSASFETEVHVWTDDARLDWTTTMSGSFFTRPEEPPGLSITTTRTLDSGAEFWSTTLRDVDLLGAQSAELRFHSSFGLGESDAYVDGAIAAELVPDRGLDVRCADPEESGALAGCGTPLEVDYLYWSFFR